MARPIEEGLQYFPLDVDIFDDPKLLFVAENFGSKGEIIAIKLLCWIYRNGYYCQWDEEHALIFARKNFSNIKSTLCQEVVSELLKRGFFNEAVFERFGVLTSKAIQTRWQNVIDRSRRKAAIKQELNLIAPEQTLEEQTLTTPEQTLTAGEDAQSAQSKVKESKVITNTPAQAREEPGYQQQIIPLPEAVDEVIAIGATRNVPAEECRMYFDLRSRDNFMRNSNQGLMPIHNWHSDLFFLHRKGALQEDSNSKNRKNGRKNINADKILSDIDDIFAEG